MSIIEDLHGQKPRFQAISGFVDYAGNVFLAATEYSDQDGYNGRVRIDKVDTSGHVSLVGTANLENGAKGDGAVIIQSGTNILVYAAGHIGDPETQWQQLPTLHGVCVAYPGGHAPFGQDGAFQGTGSEESVDYTRLQAIVHAEVQAAMVTIINNIRPKVEAELHAEHVLTETDFQDGAHGGSAIVYGQLRNTSYASDKEVEAEEGK